MRYHNRKMSAKESRTQLKDYASVRGAPVYNWGVDLAHVFADAESSLVILCSSIDERIAVHREARSLRLCSVGFTSDHPDARSDVVFWRCPDCRTWSDADKWDCGGGMGLAAYGDPDSPAFRAYEQECVTC